jgi:leucyl-tRNA synthetase
LENIDYSFEKNIGEIVIFTSNNDCKIAIDTIKILDKKIKSKTILLKNHGHFTEDDMGKTEFPELLEEVLDSEEKIKVFTTRPDTLFGATFMVLAPEHDLVQNLKSKITN